MQPDNSGINMKAVLRAMLLGWCLKNNMSEEEQDGMEEHSYFLPYCDNDRRAAECLSLFSYWSNDILSVAADYGFTTELIDSKYQVVDTPERPSEQHWFDVGGFDWDKEKEEHVWRAGFWREPELRDEGDIEA